MQEIFSDDRKFSTWRRLWVALAESERELGLNITVEQIAELRAHVDDIDYDVADAREREVRHDVMAHIYAYGKVCPDARAIIHPARPAAASGTTRTCSCSGRRSCASGRCFCAPSRHWRISRRSMPICRRWRIRTSRAQPTTVGKRATLWLQDMMLDPEHLEFVLGSMKLLGCRGTTGTGASFLDLFGGDGQKVRALEDRIAEKLGFASAYAVSGQTYTRKADYFLLSVLSGIAQSAMKFSGDIRLLSHMKEFDEPFESGQVGSSAMAYKRNPMRSERITSLARYVITDTLNPAPTAGTQWLERTLDDSANRRISIPEAFPATDGILSLCINIISGGTVYPNVIRKAPMEELPFMATENILMECVKRGGDRQILHEAIRRHAVAAGKAVKQDGADNDLLDRIAADPVFGLTRADIDAIIAAGHFTGLAPEQTRAYVAAVRAALAADPTRTAALATPDDTKVLVEPHCRGSAAIFRSAVLFSILM